MYSYFNTEQSSAACIVSWFFETVTVAPCFKFIHCSYSVLEYITFAVKGKESRILTIHYKTISIFDHK